MTRSTGIAILSFSLLILVNLIAFGFLTFRDLPEKVVTERLIQGLNEAQSLVNQTLDSASGRNLDEAGMTKRLIPHLKKYTHIRALLVIDGSGRILHREEVSGQVIQHNPDARVTPLEGSGAAMIPIRKSQDGGFRQNQIAIEYSQEAINREVDQLRKDLYRKLSYAIAVSLVLLAAGGFYVIWAYRRGRRLEEEARKADRLAYVGTLASGLAHEIRNPLNSMNMNIQMLQEEIDELGVGDAEDISDMFASTKREIQRLERLVSSFLSYARPTQIQTQMLQVNDVVREVVDFLRPEINQGGLLMDLNLSSSLPDVPIDEGQMKQALLNVIQNAVQVSQPGQKIAVTTRMGGGDKILVVVTDHGPGIAQQELDNIFKVFYSTRRGGSGLGLPIAQRIVELHGGGIKVESKVGVGTTISLILPKDPDGS